ncbi:MAG: S8 family serine peptidase [Chloroherpetonaceae bacterium]|nr:S8 family serine peptidase [Chthonomonadaceae bacterium]MDW8208571.1 S8 family serine peptidase [Chloroherpetonaceae bacterium]
MPPAGSIAVGGGWAVAGQVLVRLRPEQDTAAVRSRLGTFGTLRARPDTQRFYRLELKPGLRVERVVQELRSWPEVLYAEPNYLRFATSNDPYYVNNQQYAIHRIRLTQAWPLWKPRRQTVIAVLDTGVRVDHPDLSQMIYRDRAGQIIGFDAVTDRRMTGSNDAHGHGTLCAGVATAQTNNATGIASFAWNGNTARSDTYNLRLMPIKVLADNGSGTDEDVAQGMTWAADHGAEVLSLSLGDTVYSAVLADAAAYAWSRGCVIVGAAGNHGSTTRFYPAALPEVIAVAATDQNDMLPSWSAHGSWVSVSAPGVQVHTTTRTNSYVVAHGTSIACPHVAGLAAFLMAHNPTLTNAQIRQVIESTATPLPAQARSIRHGRIDAHAALLAAQSPPLTGIVVLDTWLREDTTPNQTGNLVRVFLFPAGSQPTSETEALGWADVPLDERGWFSLPSGVVPDGTYRVGVKPVTAYGLARLVPGDLALSAAAPPPGPTVTLPLGDANRDGSIDVLDLDLLIRAFDASPGDPHWHPGADVNGDSMVDVLDLDLFVRHFEQIADFLP